MTQKHRYQAISEEIMNMINQDFFPDGRLFSEEEFIRHFNVGKITVYNALKKLVEAGAIIRIKHKGTFVNRKEFLPPSKSLTASCIPLLMPEMGHFHGDIYNYISQKLLLNGLIPASFNYKGIDKIADNAKLIQFLKSGVRGVIIYGDGYWKRRIMDDFPDLKSVFIDFFDSYGAPPYGAVFIDYAKGIYEVTKTMISRGKKRIVMLRNEWPFTGKIPESHRQNHVSFKMDTGFCRAMEEEGLKPEIVEMPVRGINKTDSVRILKDLLSPTRLPDVIICSYDALAVKVVLEAVLMNVKIPEQLSITGFFDTPWCEECPVALSSISVDKDRIASEAVNMVVTGKFPAEPLIVKPQFIERRTT